LELILKYPLRLVRIGLWQGSGEPQSMGLSCDLWGGDRHHTNETKRTNQKKRQTQLNGRKTGTQRKKKNEERGSQLGELGVFENNFGVDT